LILLQLFLLKKKIEINYLKLSLVIIIMSDDEYSDPESVNSDNESEVQYTNPKIGGKDKKKVEVDNDDDSVDDAELSDDDADSDEEEDMGSEFAEEDEIKQTQIDSDDDADEDEEDEEEIVDVDDEGEIAEQVVQTKKSAAKNKPKKQLMILDEEDDDDDDLNENYLEKFDSQLVKNYIDDFHPECLSHNYDEIIKLSNVVRNSDGIIVDPLHRTIPYLTKYERARILGQRAKQIETGAKPMVKVPENIIDGYIIAELELKEKKIPFVIKRPIPSGGCEYWNLKDLEVIAF
jgi:DNA-directed RNA polymerase I, II, and III subunit RPABC2